MRYRELVQEQAEPKQWFEADMRTVIAWMETHNSIDDLENPGGNDPLVLIGLVGDPALKYKDLYIKGKRAFDILNSGEPITADTKTRLMRLLSSDEADEVGGMFYGDKGDDNPDSWVISVNKYIAQVDNQLLAKDAAAQYATTTLLHEAMHRGCAIWRQLVNAGYIRPSAETQFALLDSRKNVEDQITGEHAMIYNRLRRSGSRKGFRDMFVRRWAELNREGLDRFGIGAEEFNDRYVDLITDEPKTDLVDQLNLWLTIAYDKASDEIGRAVGRKMLSSPRPRARGETPQARPRPVTGRGTTRVDKPAAQVVQVLNQAISDLNRGKTPDWNRLARDIASATGHRQPTDEIIQQAIQELKNGGHKTLKPSNIQFAADLLVKK